MKIKSLTFLNCYFLFLLALVILICVSKTVNNKTSSNGVKEYENMFVKFYTKIKSELLDDGAEDLDNFSDIYKSETEPIHQNTTVSPYIIEGHNQTKRNESETLLYRKRRYLLFPEGSSFQIVFDLIIPIVDYTNFAIMGITCAVAWELPSKAPSEIENDLIEKLNDGTYGLSRNDSIDNINYIDKKPTVDHLSRIIYIQPSEYSYKTSPVKTSIYSQDYKNGLKYNNYKKYVSRPAYVVNDEGQPFSGSSSSTYNNQFKLKSINNERIGVPSTPELERLINAKRPSLQRPLKERPNTQKPRQHSVYHIMGKRSITEHSGAALQKLEKLHLQYHRSSRHELYSKIEGMFYKQGKNGTECVLRALCETGKRKHEHEPGSLVTEILRTIFTLPEADTEVFTNKYHHKHNIWDRAYHTSEECSNAYPLCENVVWSSRL